MGLTESPPSLVGARNEAQLNIVRQRILTLAGNAKLAVTGGAGSVTFTFRRGEPDTNYIAVATPSWNTTVYVRDVDKATTSCVFTFGTAPVGAETLNVTIVRSED